MAGPIKGIDIAISADTSGVTKGLHEITDQSVQVSKELKSVQSLLKFDPKNTDLLEQKQKSLAESIRITKEKLEKLRGAYDDVKAAHESGKINDEQWIAYQGEVVRTEQRLKSLESQTVETGNAMEEAGDQTDGFGDKLKNGLSVAAKAAGAAIVAVGAAALKLTKEVVKQTAELEQNLGGAQSVFGEYAGYIAKKGEEAYKTLGLSQSDYLATANKMGALFQGTGFSALESVTMTTKAMQRAADMASVMGIDMSAAMESVAGAAKGNFTMMDNLGVAINDTSIKAYALEKGLGEVETTQDKVNVAMQMFIDKTQQYDGNFAREATETISGSFGLLEASWNSLIAGLGTGEADIEQLTANLTDAFDAVAKNVAPVIEHIVAALPTVVTSLMSSLPQLLPVITTAFTELLNSMIALLPQLIPVATDAIMVIINALIDNLPQLVDAALTLIASLAQGLIEALPVLIPAIVQVVLQIVDTLLDNLDLLIDCAMQLIEGITLGLIDALPVLLEKAPIIIQKLADAIANNLPKIIEMGVRLVVAIVQGIIQNLPQIVSSATQIIDTLINVFKQYFSNMYTVATELIGKFRDGIKSMAIQAVTWGADLIQGLINGIKSKIGAITEAVSGVAEKIKSFLHFSVPDEGPLTGYDSWMPDFMKGLAAGIERNKHLVTDAVRSLAGDMVISPTANMTAAGAGAGGLSQIININISANISSDMDIRNVAEHLGRELQTITAQNAAMQGAW